MQIFKHCEHAFPSCQSQTHDQLIMYQNSTHGACLTTGGAERCRDSQLSDTLMGILSQPKGTATVACGPHTIAQHPRACVTGAVVQGLLACSSAHHMRSMDAWLPPWLLNQSVKETASSARTSRMPPSGSNSARTMGDVPSASEFATCMRLQTQSCKEQTDRVNRRTSRVPTLRIEQRVHDGRRAQRQRNRHLHRSQELTGRVDKREAHACGGRLAKCLMAAAEGKLQPRQHPHACAKK